MKSMIVKSLAGVLSGAALMLVAVSASATESNFCPAQFTELRAAINEGDFANPAKDQVGLLGKTESAVLKSNSLKVTDALKNLGEIQNKSQTLATQKKLDQASANEIYNAAGLAAACVGAISVQ